MAYFNKQVSVVAATGNIFKVKDKTAERISQLEGEIATLKQELASVQAQLGTANGRLAILDPIMGAANEFIDVVNKAFSGMNIATFDHATVEKLQKAVRTQLKGLERTKKKLVGSDTTSNLLGAAQEFSDLMTSLGKQFDTSMTNSMQVALYSNHTSMTERPVFSAEDGAVFMSAQIFERSIAASIAMTEGKVTAEKKALQLEIKLAQSEKLVAEERVENVERKLSDAHLEIEALKQQTSRVTPLEESFQFESQVSGSPTEGSTIEELNRLKKAYGELDAEHKRLRNSYQQIQKGAQNRKLNEVSRAYQLEQEITTKVEARLNDFLETHQPDLLGKFREEFPPFYLRPLNLRPGSSDDSGVASPSQSPAKAGVSLHTVRLRKTNKSGASPTKLSVAARTPIKLSESAQKTPGSAGDLGTIYNEGTASDPVYSPSQLEITDLGRNAEKSIKKSPSRQGKLARGWRRSKGSALGVVPEGMPNKGVLKLPMSNSAVLGGVQSRLAALVDVAKSAAVPGAEG